MKTSHANAILVQKAGLVLRQYTTKNYFVNHWCSIRIIRAALHRPFTLTEMLILGWWYCFTVKPLLANSYNEPISLHRMSVYIFLFNLFYNFLNGTLKGQIKPKSIHRYFRIFTEEWQKKPSLLARVYTHWHSCASCIGSQVGFV